MFSRGEPDFVNEEGTKWWRDVHLTNLCVKEDAHGTVLNAAAFFIETKEGYRTYVVVSKDSNEIIIEAQQLDAVAVQIELRKFLKRDEEQERNGANVTGSLSGTKIRKPRGRISRT